MSNADEVGRRDVFISHASEDKMAIASPLAEKLIERGHSVWFDKYELVLGDSLRRKIDAGLATSTVGVVILSHAFFSKPWPQRELDGLNQRLMSGEANVIVPVWHGIDERDLLAYSPPLADLLAARTDGGVDALVDDIERVLERIASEGRHPAVMAQVTVDRDSARSLEGGDNQVFVAMKGGGNVRGLEPEGNGAMDGRRGVALRSRARWQMLASVWLLLLACAGLFGYRLAHGSTAPEAKAGSGVIELEYPKPWRRVSAASRVIDGLHIHSPIVLAYRDEALLLAGIVSNAATGRDAVPTGLRARWIGRVTPVSVADAKGLLYRATVSGGGDRLVMFATTAGWIAVACEGAGEIALASCEEIAAGARLLDVRSRSIGPSPAVADALNAIFENVSTARMVAKADLSSALALQRADAALALAGVLEEAATSLARLSVGPREAIGLRRARKALDSGARALRALAAAARGQRPEDYARAAARASRAEAELTAALAQAGYPLQRA
jgi:hypothetical protein